MRILFCRGTPAISPLRGSIRLRASAISPLGGAQYAFAACLPAGRPRHVIAGGLRAYARLFCVTGCGAKRKRGSKCARIIVHLNIIIW